MDVNGRAVFARKLSLITLTSTSTMKFILIQFDTHAGKRLRQRNTPNKVFASAKRKCPLEPTEIFKKI
jgi:hypothetical protein